MNIRNLVVTGICKLIKLANIDKLVVEQINEVTKNEIEYLKGTNSNIQNQIDSVTSSLETAEMEQKTFKGAIVKAINAIPRNPNNSAVNVNSTLSQITHNLGEIEHGPDVGMVTATTDTVIQGYKFVDKDWNVVSGNIINHSEITKHVSLGTNGTYKKVYVRIESGAYLAPAPVSGYPEIEIPWAEFGDATAADVLKGKTFTSSSGLKNTGTMTSRAGFYHDGTKDAAHGSSDQIVCGCSTATSQNCWGVLTPKRFYYIRTPNGYYGGWGTASNAEIHVDADIMNENIGLTADKIRYGYTIAGVVGNDNRELISNIVMVKCDYMSDKIHSSILDCDVYHLSLGRYSTQIAVMRGHSILSSVMVIPIGMWECYTISNPDLLHSSSMGIYLPEVYDMYVTTFSAIHLSTRNANNDILTQTCTIYPDYNGTYAVPGNSMLLSCVEGKDYVTLHIDTAEDLLLHFRYYGANVAWVVISIYSR